MNWQKEITQRLNFIYNNNIPQSYINQIITLVEKNIIPSASKKSPWSEKDIMLITYGDSILDEKETPLVTLHKFLENYLNGKINAVHVLPFFPYSSDDGFSVINFEQVNPKLGNWTNIRNIADDYKFMTDLVINHASAKSKWFENFKVEKGEGHNYFKTESPETDLSKVTRPRNSPLLTPFKTASGTKYAWTTFSADQIDLDFGNPELLYTMLEILFLYIKNGAKLIRLDAIAFLWKESGTTCLHLPQTHEVVKLMRSIVNVVDSEIILLTETNVPNKENLSYFGNNDEAHMVYQFSLPPLLLHALNSGNSTYLTNWAKSIPNLPKDCTFFNFTSSHDGIGVRPLEGLLPDDEKKRLLKDIKLSGGLISTKSNSDGSSSPYELNITYYDALKRTHEGEDNLQNDRFLCSQFIMLAMKGIPAFYIHSLLASHNNLNGVNETGRARTINRKQLQYSQIVNDLQKPTNRQYVFNQLSHACKVRKQYAAFHPSANQEIIDVGSDLFAIKRTDSEGNTISSVSNLTKQTLILPKQFNENNFDVITNVNTNQLAPYQTVWLK